MGREPWVLGAVRRGAAAGALLGSAMAPARAADLGAVEGIVLRVDGTPVPYANVLIVGQRRGNLSDDFGRFHIGAVPPGHWQRARPRDDEPTLVSCVVVPGFDYADFSLAAPTD